MATVVPSILETDLEAFKSSCSRVLKVSGIERVHIDFCDGKFVKNTTIDAGALDLLNPAFSWEAHLMVNNPSDFLDYSMLGFKIIVVHYEAFDSVADLIKTLESINSLGLKGGVAIKPKTPVKSLQEISDYTDFFQVMGVEPGFQGAEFVASTPDRIKELRGLLPNAIIEVDGGVKLENIRNLADAGADLLNAGSALLKAPDMQDAYNKLTEALH